MGKNAKIVSIVIIAINILVLVTVFYIWVQSEAKVKASNKLKASQTLKEFSLRELSKYDGTNPKLPIYLALNGLVYDISKGKEFYQVGGPYHDLAGKDSSKELNLVGGGIIKRKYPVVGTLLNQK